MGGRRSRAVVAGVMGAALVWTMSAGVPAGAGVVAGPSAYVTNRDADTVTPIDTATDTAGPAISVGSFPWGVTVTPDGAKAFVANFTDNTVSAIDTSTNAVVATIPVGLAPYGMEVTPDGATLYVTSNGNGTVVPVDTATYLAGTPIPVGGNGAWAVAVTPHGTSAYVTNPSDDHVTPIDVATGGTRTPIDVGDDPRGIDVTPDGSTAYVANNFDDTVTPIDIPTESAGSPIPVGENPGEVEVTPDGSTAYVVNTDDDTVTPIDTAGNTPGPPISVGPAPYGLGITPDGSTAYVTSQTDGTVTPIDTATNTTGPSVLVGAFPSGVGIMPPPPLEPGRVEGTVTESASGPSATAVGDPIEGVFAAAFDASAQPFVIRGVVTDGAGGYGTDVPPGEYGLAFFDPTMAHVFERHDDTTGAFDLVTVSGGGTVDIDAGLFSQVVDPPDDPATISGTVTDGSDPVAGAWVVGVSLDGDPGGGAVTAGDGTFSLGGLAPGDYWVEIVDPTGVYAVEWWEDASGPGAATSLTLDPNGAENIAPVLDRIP